MYSMSLDSISTCKTTEVEQYSATPVATPGATPVRKRDADASSVDDSGKGGSQPDVSMKPGESQEPTDPKDTPVTAASVKPEGTEGVLAVPEHKTPKLIGGLTQRQAWFSQNLEGPSLIPTSCIIVFMGFPIFPCLCYMFHIQILLCMFNARFLIP